MSNEATDACKASLRRRMKAVRDSLSPGARSTQSALACANLASLDAFQRASAVAAYVPFGSELDTWGAIRAAEQAGKRIALPQVTGRQTMRFARYQTGDRLYRNRYGICEPANGAQTVDASDLDLVVVPGLAFDAQGVRLGYGGGHYDRYLAQATRAVRVGIAFLEQVVARVPADSHDVRMHITLTSNGPVDIAS